MVARPREGKLQSQTSAALRHHPLQRQAKGVNPDRRTGVGDPKAVGRCSQHLSGSSSDDTNAKLYRILPFPWTILVAWTARTCCLAGQQLVLHILLPRPAPWIRHSSFVQQRLTQHGKRQSTGDTPHCSIGVDRGFRRWGRSSDLTGQPPASNVLARHGSSACVRLRVLCPTNGPKNPAPGKERQIKKQKTPALKRTICIYI